MTALDERKAVVKRSLDPARLLAALSIQAKKGKHSRIQDQVPVAR